MNLIANKHLEIRKHLWFIILIIGLCNVTGSFSQISFAPFKTYEAGADPEAVCIGDINNDGLNDVVLATGYSFDPATDYKIYVFLQAKNGTLATPIIYSYPAFYPGITCLMMKDMNNDKLNDVVIAYKNSIGIFFQNNSGTLNALKSYATAFSGIRALESGDLNHDGLNDMVVATYGSNIIQVFYQAGSDNFTTHTYAAPANGLIQVKVADINNDGLDDVVGNDYAAVYVFSQNNSGTLNSYVAYDKIPSIWSFWGLDVGDLNNDGRNDVVVTKFGNSPESKIELFFQDAAMQNLKSPIQLLAYDCPEPVIIENLNCDSRNEIIVLHGGWQAISVYEQDKTGNYYDYSKFSLPYATHYNNQGISIGDINNDGKKDVAIADYNNGLVILINQSSNNGFVQKPLTPKGMSVICNDNQTVTYKTQTLKDDKTHWNLFPAEAGSIISYARDSCKISWNNNWIGKAGISVKVTNVCGENTSDTLYITSNRLPLLNLGNDTSLCAGNTLKLKAGKGFASYQWQDNSTDSVLLVTKSGSYFVKAGNNCGYRYDTISIATIPLPDIQLRDTFLCLGIPVYVNATLQGNNTYRWQDNSTNPVYTISTPGNYSLSVTDAYLCRNSKSFYVKEITPPKIQLPGDTAICMSQNLELNVTSAGCNYRWQDGNTSALYTIANDGTYSVEVSNQCAIVNANVTVSFVNCNAYLDVPTAFSPNGDGLNDVLYAVSTNVKNMRFIIYNRWGQKVFESTNTDTGWDGTLQGKKLDSGVFIFYVSGTSILDGQYIQNHGNVSLIR